MIKKKCHTLLWLVCFWQVGIYLLETGLGKPEFLSEGSVRLKKANQLMQKLMEYFYDFIIPGKCQVLKASLLNLNVKHHVAFCKPLLHYTTLRH